MALRVNTSDCVVELAESEVLCMHKFLSFVHKMLIFLLRSDIYTYKTIQVEKLVQIILSELYFKPKSTVHQISKSWTLPNLDLALALYRVDFMFLFQPVHCLTGTVCSKQIIQHYCLWTEFWVLFRLWTHQVRLRSVIPQWFWIVGMGFHWKRHDW